MIGRLRKRNENSALDPFSRGLYFSLVLIPEGDLVGVWMCGVPL